MKQEKINGLDHYATNCRTIPSNTVGGMTLISLSSKNFTEPFFKKGRRNIAYMLKTRTTEIGFKRLQRTLITYEIIYIAINVQLQKKKKIIICNTKLNEQ